MLDSIEYFGLIQIVQNNPEASLDLSFLYDASQVEEVLVDRPV